jgi:hypothetical protein
MKTLNDWQRRRAVLSHDVLKNRIAPSLAKLCRVVTGQVDAPDFVEEFEASGAKAIERACEELDFLLESAEDSLSPRQLFGSPPLSDFPPGTLQWLPDALHGHWTARAQLDFRKCHGRTQIDQTQRALEKWREAAEQHRLTDLQPLSLHLRDIFASLTDFTSSLADLPPYRI